MKFLSLVLGAIALLSSTITLAKPSIYGLTLEKDSESWVANYEGGRLIGKSDITGGNVYSFTMTETDKRGGFISVHAGFSADGVLKVIETKLNAGFDTIFQRQQSDGLKVIYDNHTVPSMRTALLANNDYAVFLTEVDGITTANFVEVNIALKMIKQSK